ETFTKDRASKLARFLVESHLTLKKSLDLYATVTVAAAVHRYQHPTGRKVTLCGLRRPKRGRGRRSAGRADPRRTTACASAPPFGVNVEQYTVGRAPL